MDKQRAFEIMRGNPVFYLATCEGNTPRVRGMLLYQADGDGIVFHTGAIKDLYRQVQANPNAELCFVDVASNTQVRVSGTLEIVDDNALKDQIKDDPARSFVKMWVENGQMEDFYRDFIVLRMRDGVATHWDMSINFAPKTYTELF